MTKDDLTPEEWAAACFFVASALNELAESNRVATIVTQALVDTVRGES
jgi:hypothetical protein